MTKRLIDVDDEKVAAVQELLGTGTLKATAHAALGEQRSPAPVQRQHLVERGVDLAALADPSARQAAWG